MRKVEQLDLFGGSSSSAPAEEQRGAAASRDAELASRLPEHLRLGTSSWTFPGWAGLVYHRRYPSTRAFVRDSLGEYARHPLFRAVGMDRSHYAPVSEAELRDYARLLPAGFTCVTKVWSELSTPTVRGGHGTPRSNPRFLDLELLEREILGPARRAFAEHQGPFVFQVPPVPAGPRAFADAVERFLSHAPAALSPGRPITYGFELRDRKLLTRRYVEVLRAHGAAHVFNWWERMPSLSEQLERTGGLVGPLVVRLLIPPGRRYAELKEAWAPFDRLVQPHAEMRRDVVRLARLAEAVGVPAWVLANNKAEGCSPLTVRAIAELLARPARG